MFCKEFYTRLVDKVKSYQYKAEGAIIKVVQIQLQREQNRQGIVKDKDFQVVEEGLQRVSRDRQIGAKVTEDYKNRRDCSSRKRVEGDRKQEEEVN